MEKESKNNNNNEDRQGRKPRRERKEEVDTRPAEEESTGNVNAAGKPRRRRVEEETISSAPDSKGWMSSPEKSQTGSLDENFPR